MRANHSKFISEELSKEIRLRSKLRNKFLKDKTNEARIKYGIHLLRRAKRNYYNDLDLSNVTENRKFWKTIRPLLHLERRSGILHNNILMMMLYDRFAFMN